MPIDFAGVEEPKAEIGPDFSGVEGVDFSGVQPESAPKNPLLPETLDVSAQPDFSGVQDLHGTPVAPGMPTNASEVAPQGLNERGITTIMGSPVGIPEAIANTATGILGFTAGKGYQAFDTLGRMLTGSKDPVGEAKQVGEKISQYLTYQPQSESGKELSGFAGGIMNAPFEAIKKGLEVTQLPKEYQDAVMEGLLSGLALTGAAHTFKPRTLDEYIMKSKAEISAKEPRQPQEAPESSVHGTPEATTEPASPTDWAAEIGRINEPYREKAPVEAGTAPEPTVNFPSPLDIAKEHVLKGNEGEGLSPEAVGRIAGNIAYDAGMPDYYRKEYIRPFADKAIEHVKASGEEVSRTHFDIGNLTGINLKEGHEAANGHIKNISEIIKQSFEESIPKDKLDFGREGGDEMSVYGRGVSKSDLDSAAQTAKIRVEKYAKDNGLVQLPSKRGVPEDVSLHSNTENINEFLRNNPAATAHEFLIFNDAKRAHEGAKNELRVSTKAPRAVASEERPSGSVEGNAENPRQVPAEKPAGSANPAEVAPESSPKKEPWQMTRDGYLRSRLGKRHSYKDIEAVSPGKIDNLSAMHKASIQDALEAGKPVPAEVLKDYSEIQKLYSFPANLAPKKIAEDFKLIKEDLNPLWEKYSKVPEFTDYKKALGKYLGDRQQVSFELNKFAKRVQKEIPEVKQNGITNWIEAGGDRATLEKRLAATKDEKLQAGYKAALELSPNEVNFAEAAKKHFDEQLERAVEAGVIEDGVENYVNHIWDRENGQAKKVKSEINAGLLRTNPALAKKRIWETFFEGEQAGGVPKDKRIGYLMTAYDQALGEAIASRLFVKELLKAKESDGRPVVAVPGYGSVLKEGDSVKGTLIKPNAKAQEIGDYRVIDHPALRKWKWVAADTGGNPVYMMGDFLVHPDSYQHLKNVLGKSKIQENWLGRNTLKLSQEFKSTLLSLSGFHQVQEGVHAIFHKVNPAGAPEINFRDAAQKSLVDHGLMIYDHDALQNFSEGVATTGIINRIPGIGPIMQKYQSYLFTDYIPRLKMAMAKEALERNRARYNGKLSDDQIQAMTANQANAAFGELNYKMMGRNKTMQDVFRLMALAPDFLEARARFVGQALKPYGKEQSTALIRGALGMYAGAVMLNMLLSDDNKPHWDKPFTVVVGEREYALRSIPGDLIHLFRDPRSFVYGRLNPTTARTVVESITGRDQWGNKKGLEDQFSDLRKNIVPIPIQGPLWKEDSNLLNSVLTSIGIASWKHKTEAEKVLRDISAEKRTLGGASDNQQERFDLVRDLKKKYKAGDISSLAEIRQAAKDAGVVLSSDQIRSITAGDKQRPFKDRFKHLTAEESMRVWDVATDEEKMQSRGVVMNKILNAKTLTQQDKREYRQRILQ